MCVQVLAVTSYAQPAEEPAEVELEELSIIGQDQTLSTMTLSTKDLSKSVSAVNPLDSLNRLPGVNFAGSDAMGFYEYGQNFSLRIFQKNQVAVTVDGVPLNSQDPAGGSPAGRFLDMESLSSITVSQGSGDLSTASNYGLGGRIDFTTGTPKDSMALQTDYTVGSESLQRAYVRADTGVLPGGGKAYFAYSDTEFDKWRSLGDQLRTHIEAKYLHPLGDRGTISLNFIHNDRDDHDFLDVTLPNYRLFGRDYGLNTQWYGDSTIDQNYFDTWTNRRDDYLTSLNVDFELTDNIDLKFVPYWSDQDGVGTWSPPYILTDTNPDGTVDAGGARDTTRSSWRETQYALERKGFTASLDWDIGNIRANGGFWYETSERNHRREWFEFPNYPVFSKHVNSYGVQFDDIYDIDTFMFFLAGAYDITDSLELNAGFRYHDIDFDYQNKFDATANFSGEDKDEFLPQIGLTFDLGEKAQIFANWSENFSQRPDQAIKQTAPYVSPETSTNLDIGYRRNSDKYFLQTALYWIQHEDVIEFTRNGDRFTGVDEYLNVGGIQSWGIEFSGGYEISEGLDAFGSVTWNNSEYDGNLIDGNAPNGTHWVIDGNDPVMIPEWMFFAEVTYNIGDITIGANNRFMGERHTTRTNDEKLDSYNLVGAFARYQGEFNNNVAYSVSFNILNAFDEDYLASTSALGAGSQNEAGNASFMPGSPRTYALKVSLDF